MTIASPTPGPSTLAQQDEDVAMAPPSSSSGALGNADEMDVATASNETRVSFELPSTSVAIGSALDSQGPSVTDAQRDGSTAVPTTPSTVTQQGNPVEDSPNNGTPSFHYGFAC